MHSIAVLNQKGGVGKTTSVANLSAAFARTGLRVLMIDLDPQAHLTLNFGVDGKSEKSVYAVLEERVGIAEAAIPLSDTLSLIPSHLDLAAAEVELVSVVGREVILRDALEAVEDDYDLMLMDCPPSLGTLAINSLAAANEVLIPLQPHFLALQGLGKLLHETIRLVSKRINPSLRVGGVIMTMYEGSTRLATEIVDDVKDFFAASHDAKCPWSDARVFRTPIRRNIKLAEAPSHGVTIFEYEPRCNGAIDYAALADEWLEVNAERLGFGSSPDAVEEPVTAPDPTPENSASSESTEEPTATIPAAEPKLGSPDVAVPASSDVPDSEPAVENAVDEADLPPETYRLPEQHQADVTDTGDIANIA